MDQDSSRRGRNNEESDSATSVFDWDEENFGAGLDREERLFRSDGYGSSSEPVADKTSGRADQVFRWRDDGAVCGSFDWRQPAHGDLILPQTAGSDRSAPE